MSLVEFSKNTVIDSPTGAASFTVGTYIVVGGSLQGNVLQAQSITPFNTTLLTTTTASTQQSAAGNRKQSDSMKVTRTTLQSTPALEDTAATAFITNPVGNPLSRFALNFSVPTSSCSTLSFSGVVIYGSYNQYVWPFIIDATESAPIPENQSGQVNLQAIGASPQSPQMNVMLFGGLSAVIGSTWTDCRGQTFKIPYSITRGVGISVFANVPAQFGNMSTVLSSNSLDAQVTCASLGLPKFFSLSFCPTLTFINGELDLQSVTFQNATGLLPGGLAPTASLSVQPENSSSYTINAARALYKYQQINTLSQRLTFLGYPVVNGKTLTIGDLSLSLPNQPNSSGSQALSWTLASTAKPSTSSGSGSPTFAIVDNDPTEKLTLFSSSVGSTELTTYDQYCIIYPQNKSTILKNFSVDALAPASLHIGDGLGKVYDAIEMDNAPEVLSSARVTGTANGQSGGGNGPTGLGWIFYPSPGPQAKGQGIVIPVSNSYQIQDSGVFPGFAGGYFTIDRHVFVFNGGINPVRTYDYKATVSDGEGGCPDVESP